MRRALTALLACSGLALIAGCGSSASSSGSATTGATTGAPSAAPPTSSGPAQSGSVKVRYEGIAINPTAITVKTGTVITWTNYDDTPHNVTAQSGPATFTSMDFSKGASYSYTATKPGVIHYLCTIHPASMQGTITVVQ